MELNPKTSAGFDVIKDAINILTTPLTLLFNTSVVSFCLISNMLHLYKKNVSTNIENYRPIRILQFLKYLKGKCFNKSHRMFLVFFLRIYVVFRKGYNAQHALLGLKKKQKITLDKQEKNRNVYDGYIQDL